MKKFLLIVFLGLSLARAGDSANFDFIGFSKNGQYLAFRQYGISDGSGYSYANLYIVGVAKNTLNSGLSFAPDIDNVSVAQVRIGVLAKASASLKRYGIVNGNQGRFAAGGSGGTSMLEFNALGRDYTLEIETRDGDKKIECVTGAPRLLKITLFGLKPRILQNDTKLPASRRCAFSYAIHSVFVYGSSLAVFIAVSTDGFESPDLRFMAVTAKL